MKSLIFKTFKTLTNKHFKTLFLILNIIKDLHLFVMFSHELGHPTFFTKRAYCYDMMGMKFILAQGSLYASKIKIPVFFFFSKNSQII